MSRIPAVMHTAAAASRLVHSVRMEKSTKVNCYKQWKLMNLFKVHVVTIKNSFASSV